MRCKVKNGGLCCSKRTDNPMLKKFDTGKETEIERQPSEYESLDKDIDNI